MHSENKAVFHHHLSSGKTSRQSFGTWQVGKTLSPGHGAEQTSALTPLVVLLHSPKPGCLALGTLEAAQFNWDLLQGAPEQQQRHQSLWVVQQEMWQGHPRCFPCCCVTSTAQTSLQSKHAAARCVEHLLRPTKQEQQQKITETKGKGGASMHPAGCRICLTWWGFPGKAHGTGTAQLGVTSLLPEKALTALGAGWESRGMGTLQRVTL